MQCALCDRYVSVREQRGGGKKKETRTGIFCCVKKRKIQFTFYRGSVRWLADGTLTNTDVMTLRKGQTLLYDVFCIVLSRRLGLKSLWTSRAQSGRARSSRSLAAVSFDFVAPATTVQTR